MAINKLTWSWTLVWTGGEMSKSSLKTCEAGDKIVCKRDIEPQV